MWCEKHNINWVYYGCPNCMQDEIAHLKAEKDKYRELLKRCIEEDVSGGFLTPELFNLIHQVLEE